jgi:hypothetical protein
MKTGIAAAALISLFSLGAPALAGDGRNWRDDRREWREDAIDWRGDRWEQRQAYARGYQDGLRADARRDAQRWSRSHDGRFGQAWRSTDWRHADDGYRYQGAAYPYRGTAGAAPYWWGSGGQVQCRRQDGTTGLVVGALAGGTLGNMIAGQGDKRLGSVIGGTLGAVLGNELASGRLRCR